MVAPVKFLRSEGWEGYMSSPFVGEVRAWGCNFAPKGWAFCAAQILSIQQNTALFSLIGTYYGGNGTSNFQLPDLRGRVPMKFGTDPSGNVYSIGEISGVEQVTITSQQMPVHTHVFGGTSSTGADNKPKPGAALGTSSQLHPYYAASNSSTTTINPGTVSGYSGGNQAHTNIQPYQAINWCIALTGIYPARN
jgi:microcystin-dependent protein